MACLHWLDLVLSSTELKGQNSSKSSLESSHLGPWRTSHWRDQGVGGNLRWWRVVWGGWGGGWGGWEVAGISWCFVLFSLWWSFFFHSHNFLHRTQAKQKKKDPDYCQQYSLQFIGQVGWLEHEGGGVEVVARSENNFSCSRRSFSTSATFAHSCTGR